MVGDVSQASSREIPAAVATFAWIHSYSTGKFPLGCGRQWQDECPADGNLLLRHEEQRSRVELCSARSLMTDGHYPTTGLGLSLAGVSTLVWPLFGSTEIPVEHPIVEVLE